MHHCHIWQADKNWGYRSYKTRQELNDQYAMRVAALRPLIGNGLAAAIYTQTTDVEIEVNGFMTYDRAVVKLDTDRVKPLHEPDRRAFETLGFSGFAKADEVRTAYKKLVKLHHPDANGGDKSSEDRLRAVIAAYAHLKSKGFVGR